MIGRASSPARFASAATSPPMKTILQILVSPRPNSWSRRLAREIIGRIAALHPGAPIVERDLATDPPPHPEIMLYEAILLPTPEGCAPCSVRTDDRRIGGCRCRRHRHADEQLHRAIGEGVDRPHRVHPPHLPLDPGRQDRDAARPAGRRQRAPQLLRRRPAEAARFPDARSFGRSASRHWPSCGSKGFPADPRRPSVRSTAPAGGSKRICCWCCGRTERKPCRSSIVRPLPCCSSISSRG